MKIVDFYKRRTMQYQDFNFHTHTYRCGHAVKTEDDYIQSAIQSGFKVLGFSEHCGYDGFDSSRERIPFKEMDNYFSDIKKAEEKYKSDIKIYVGLEFEYFDDLNSYYTELKEKYDYLVIGQHLKDRKGYDYTYRCTDKDVRYMAYQVCMALENGFAKYVAHPDYFMLARDNYSKECEKAVREIVQCAKKNDAFVEINLKGMRYGIQQYDGYKSYKYPHNKTIEIYKEENAKVVIGYDAHNPQVLLQREYEDIARQMGEGLDFLQDYREILFDKK